MCDCEALGHTLYARSGRFVLVTGLAALLLCLGCARLGGGTENQQQLWLPGDSEAVRAQTRHDAQFGRVQTAELLFELGDSAGDIFAAASLLQLAFSLEQHVLSNVTAAAAGARLVTFADVCARGPSQRACLFESPFLYWNDSLAALQADPNPRATASNPLATHPSSGGHPLRTRAVFGGLVWGPNETLTRASALRFAFYLNASELNDTTAAAAAAEAWQIAFLAWASTDARAAASAAGASLQWMTSTAQPSELARTLRDDVFAVQPVPTAVAFKFFIDLFSLSRANARVLPALAALASTLLAVFGALGVAGLARVTFTGMQLVLVGLVLFETGLFHCKLLVHLVENLLHRKHSRLAQLPVEDALGSRADALEHSSLFVSALSILVPAAAPPAVAAGMATLVIGVVPSAPPALRGMAFIVGAGFVLELALLCFFFAPALAWSVQRPLLGCWPCATPEASPFPRRMQRLLRWIYERALPRLPLRVASGVAALALVVAGTAGLATFEQPQVAPARFYRSDSYVAHYLEREATAFPDKGLPLELVVGTVNYADPTQGAELRELGAQLSASAVVAQNVPPRAQWWYTAFLDACAHIAPSFNITLVNGTYPPPQFFARPLLAAFLANYTASENLAFFTDDLLFAPGCDLCIQPLAATRAAVASVPCPSTSAQLEVKAHFSRLAEERQLRPAYAYAPQFVALETVEHTLLWSWYALAAASISIALVLAATLPPRHALAGAAVIATLVLLAVGIFARFKELPLDQRLLPAWLTLPYFALAVLFPALATRWRDAALATETYALVSDEAEPAARCSLVHEEPAAEYALRLSALVSTGNAALIGSVLILTFGRATYTTYFASVCAVFDAGLILVGALCVPLWLAPMRTKG